MGQVTESAEYKAAREAFGAYFRRNYPGPDTIIGKPDWHSPKIFRAAIVALHEAGILTKPADAAPAQSRLWPDAQDVKDIVADGGGFWRACTGCHEPIEGVPAGPLHPVLKCHLGPGCCECGGIGAVWDTTDYTEFIDWRGREAVDDAEAQTPPPPASRVTDDAQ